MFKEELVNKSPVRILEKSIEGGIKAGQIGFIVSKKGIGKTSVLVQIALDKLMQGERVIHISFNSHTSYVIDWYKNIFAEIAKRKRIDNLNETMDELVKNRVVFNFTQDGLKIDQVIGSISALIKEGKFSASTIIIDGFDFEKSNKEDLEKVLAFAKEHKVFIWYSVNVTGDYNVSKNGLPSNLKIYEDLISVLINLEPMADHIHFQVLKHNTGSKEISLKLDSKTLLIAEI